MDQIPQGQPTPQPVQPVAPQAAASIPQAQPAQPIQIPSISPTLTPPTPSPSKLKSPKLWIGAGVGLLIIVVVFALFTGKPELLPGKVPTAEQIAGCAAITIPEKCMDPDLGGICDWVKLPDGKQTCQAVGAKTPAAEAPPPEEAPPPPAGAPPAEQPQEQRTAARCAAIMTPEKCMDPDLGGICDWVKSDKGIEQCQAVGTKPSAAEAPPPTEAPSPPSGAPPAEQPREQRTAARCAAIMTPEKCMDPDLGGICDWVKSDKGIEQCQAIGAAPGPAKAPPTAEEPTPAAEVPTSEPQAEEAAAAPIQCENLIQALCGSSRYAERCEWVVTLKNGKPQSQCQPMQTAAAPPPAPPPPATQPQPPVEIYPVEEPKEKEKVEIVTIRPQQPVTPQSVAPQLPAVTLITPTPVTPQPVTSSSPKPKPVISQPEPLQPSTPQPITESNAQEEARIRDLENLVASLQQQLAAAQNTNNSVQINALNEQIANIIAEMNNLRQAAGQPVVINIPTPAPAPSQAAPAPSQAPAPAVSAPSSGNGTEIIAVAVKDAQKKKEKKIASTATAESDSASAPAVLDGSGAAGTAAGAASSASAASASSARAAHGAFIQGRTGPGILLYPILVAAANGMYFLLRKKKR